MNKNLSFFREFLQPPTGLKAAVGVDYIQINVGSNSMTNNLIIEKAIEEVETKKLGVTEQFLKIHKIVYADNKPNIARVDTDK